MTLPQGTSQGAAYTIHRLITLLGETRNAIYAAFLQHHHRNITIPQRGPTLCRLIDPGTGDLNLRPLCERAHRELTSIAHQQARQYNLQHDRPTIIRVRNEPRRLLSYLQTLPRSRSEALTPNMHAQVIFDMSVPAYPSLPDAHIDAWLSQLSHLAQWLMSLTICALIWHFRFEDEKGLWGIQELNTLCVGLRALAGVQFRSNYRMHLIMCDMYEAVEKLSRSPERWTRMLWADGWN